MRAKTKKAFTAAGAVAMAGVLALCCGVLSACKGGEKKDDTKEIKVSSVATSDFDHFYTPDDVINFDEFKLTVMYSDNSKKEISDIEFHDGEEFQSDESLAIVRTDGLYDRVKGYGSAEEGKYALSCFLRENETEYALGSVVVGDDITYFDVLTFEVPDFQNTYEDNLTRCGDKEDDNNFVGTVTDYCVGDDNGFIYRPSLTLVDMSDFTHSFVQKNYEADVTVKLSGSSDALNLSDNLYVSYSDFTFYFTETAVGERFEITVTPSAFERDFVATPIESASITVLVCDGYNVYDAIDIGHMALVEEGADLSGDFTGDPSRHVFWNEETDSFEYVTYYELWRDFLKEKGESDDELKPCNGIYLHGDILITSDDIPERFFVSQKEADFWGVDYDEMVGSVRDYSFIYSHYMTDDFTFNGNLFKIDCSTLKYTLTYRRSGFGDDGTEYGLNYYSRSTTSVNTSNAALFAFFGKESDALAEEGVSESSRPTATFENVDIVGNMSNPNYSVSGKESGWACGSLQLVMSESSKLEISNMISKDFVMAIDCQKSLPGYDCLDMRDSKVFDCFNCGIFLYFSAENSVKNSVFKRIGGPVVMARSRAEEDVDDDGKEHCIESGCVIDEKTIIENYIAGDEAWFTSMGVTFIAPLLAEFDVAFNRVGKTIYTGESTSVGAAGDQVTAPAVNLHFMGIDANMSSRSSGDRGKLNLNFSLGDSQFLLNENSLAKGSDGKDVMTYDPEYYGSQAEYVSAMLNSYMDSNLSSSIAFVTNTGKIFTIASLSSLSSETPFYTMESWFEGSSALVPQTLTKDDTEIYLYSWIGGYGAVLAMALGDYVVSD
ncbi:MAG: hypothetical protein LUD29_05360 [Clostridia bacterium]|nr:hypothetical protein [Clostridia bacterium]